MGVLNKSDMIRFGIVFAASLTCRKKQDPLKRAQQQQMGKIYHSQATNLMIKKKSPAIKVRHP